MDKIYQGDIKIGTFTEKAKKILKKIFAVILILIIVFSPYLLIIDFKRYAVVVLFVWMFSVVYFLFIKEK